MGVWKVASAAMWIASELYLSLKRPLTTLGVHGGVPLGSPTTTFCPWFTTISGASWKEVESMPSVSGMGLGDFTMGNGVAVARVKSCVSVSPSFTTFLVIGAAV